MPTRLTSALMPKFLLPTGQTNKVVLHEILFLVHDTGKRIAKVVVPTFYPVFSLNQEQHKYLAGFSYMYLHLIFCDYCCMSLS